MGEPYLVIFATILGAVLGIAQAIKLMKTPRDPRVAIDYRLAGVALLLVVVVGASLVLYALFDAWTHI